MENDQLGKSFLTKPDLLTHLCDPETLSKIAKTHPCLLEAANNLAAAVHEEQQSAGCPNNKYPITVNKRQKG